MANEKSKYAVFILVFLHALLLAGCSQEVSDFQTSWEARALELQRQLDDQAPLVRATFLATHNSYNAAAYTRLNRYLDPNQVHSLFDQLRMGIRALELDVHSFPRYDLETETFVPDLLLCHGTDNHLGCSPFDHPFEQGLQEIADWLSWPENQNEVVLLYIEEHIDDPDFQESVAQLEQALGDSIYKPTDSGCQGIPTELSEADVLAAGKQVILITDGCRNNIFNQWVFAGIEGDMDGYPTSNKDLLAPFPTCDGAGFSRTDYQQLLIRIQEDRTILSNAVDDGLTTVTPELVQRMVECEVNIIGMDKLRPFDGRLRSAIWSWAENQPPQNPEGLCASHGVEQRFTTLNCSSQQAFACRDTDTGQWTITQSIGPWQQGAELCQQEGLGEFAAPVSGYDNLLLATEKFNAAVWINAPVQ